MSAHRLAPSGGWQAFGLCLAAMSATLLVTATSAAASVSWAGSSPPQVGPEEDASCATMPESYPANGEPVPVEATCVQLASDNGVATGEVWSWRDDDGLHWYNFPAESYLAPAGTTLLMCGSTDDGAAGAEYECTAESPNLLFTMPNLFVTWPTESPDDHHFCETVRLLDPFGIGVEGRACGTIDAAGGETSPPTSTPPPAPPAEPGPTEPAPPTQSPTGEPSSSPNPAPEETVQTAPPTAVPVPNFTGSSGPAASGPAASPSASLTSDPRDPPQGAGESPEPDEAALVAVVGGGRFPVSVVLLIAVALAASGVMVLVTPGLVQARRRR